MFAMRSNLGSGTLSMLMLMFLLSNCVDQKARDAAKKRYDTVEKIKTIELGMSKDEVLRILGKPPKELEYNYEGISHIAMLYEARSESESTSPSIILCKETQRVIRVIVDDSGKFDKRSKSPNPCLNPAASNQQNH